MTQLKTNQLCSALILLIVILTSACASSPTVSRQQQAKINAEGVIAHDMELAVKLISDNTIPIANAQDSLKHITSPSAFARIALESNREILILNACFRIDNEQVLYELLNTREVSDKCTNYALKTIESPALLKQLLLSKSFDGIQVYDRNFFMLKIKDIAFVEKIAEQHSQPRIRNLAKQTLEERQLRLQLKQISTENDDEKLLRMAVQTTESRIWKAAIARISGPDALYRLILKLKDKRDIFSKLKIDQSIKRITDQPILAAITVQLQTRLNENQAFKQLIDQNQLFEVARAGIDPAARLSTMATVYVREAAARRINNPSHLANIALNDPKSRVRAAALENIHDQALLIRVATQGVDEWERTVATANLMDRSTLRTLQKKSGKESKIASLRLALMDIESTAVATPIILKQKITSAEYTVSGPGNSGYIKRKGEKVTISILNRSTKKSFSFTKATEFPASIRLRGKLPSETTFHRAQLSEQDLMAPLSEYLFSLTPGPDMSTLATAASSGLLKAVALENVTSQQLIESAYNDPSDLVRRVVVDRLTNQLLLELLALNDKNNDVRSSATKKVDNIEVLLKLSSDEENNLTVRFNAQRRLKMLGKLK